MVFLIIHGVFDLMKFQSVKTGRDGGRKTACEKYCKYAERRSRQVV